jgi:hypothetical protein
MRKLENIKKSNIFEVPDEYFDRLPLSIQARIEKTRPLRSSESVMSYALRYALPVVVLFVVMIAVFRPQTDPSVETMLGSVSTEQLIAYLEDTSLTTDELLESFEFDDELLDAVELEVYNDFELDSNSIEVLMNELDF